MEQKNKNDKASLILETIKKTVLKSKVHGLSNMIRVDSKIMKTIWFFCFFTSMGYCFSQIFISFYHYFHLIFLWLAVKLSIISTYIIYRQAC